MRLLLLCAAAAVCVVDVEAQRRSRGGGGANRTWEFLSEKYDKNKDGKVSWKEYARDKDKFASLDTDGDGGLTADDFGRGGRGSGRRGRGGRSSRGGASAAPKVGQAAPDFDLPTLDDANWKQASNKSGQKSPNGKPGKPGKASSRKTSQKSSRRTVQLSSFKGKKPVALIFGSYT